MGFEQQTYNIDHNDQNYESGNIQILGRYATVDNTIHAPLHCLRGIVVLVHCFHPINILCKHRLHPKQFFTLYV